MTNNEFISWFESMTKMDTNNSSNTVKSEKYEKSMETGLNDLWNDYHEYLQEIKDRGYKVYRDSNGNHKVVM